MRQFFVVLLTAIILGSAASLFTACNKANQSSDAATQYTCPMHPEVITNAPGKCPKCGMDLKPKK